MNIVSVAVGKQYELEVQRLVNHYPQTIVITERTFGAETAFTSSILNGLATKCKFGTLLPKDLKGPIIFCDADLYPVVDNPLQYFKVKEETDIAYVVYTGSWHFPPRLKEYAKAIEKTGKLNSGFMYFKNIDVCQDVCLKWYNVYMERMDHHKINPNVKLSYEVNSQGEYDEPSLVFVLNKEKYNIEFLDPKWNVWDNFDGTNAYFIQKHIGDWTMYKEIPTFRNEA